ncbi:MAG: 1,6-anhydro-N-acetylmuramyl-L-alanine amidase AmpD [Pseudomonadales bacterium]|nr:1,6-anhydro-N-acetylmuramyl-L-alanine amidase AmpD [Pseudomonadales bacterium]MBO7004897.1 1,6-anhydro-N-acetylmuramyl-L-alanine amidase AmpD [Pseudomonadales bacterium]
MEIRDHHLIGVKQLESPNHDQRPDVDLELIVVHGISLPPGEFGGSEVEQLFLNTLDTSRAGLEDLAGVHVSSHVFIKRTGEIVQFVPFNRRAWHAGVSEFRGRQSCNDFSIGIEVEGTDHESYTAEQYDVLGDVCVTLMRAYDIHEIRGHSDVAPGRKTDPGPAFSWLTLMRRVAKTL